MLFVDKHRPKTIEGLSFNNQLTIQLKELVGFMMRGILTEIILTFSLNQVKSSWPYRFCNWNENNLNPAHRTSISCVIVLTLKVCHGSLDFLYIRALNSDGAKDLTTSCQSAVCPWRVSKDLSKTLSGNTVHKCLR